MNKEYCLRSSDKPRTYPLQKVVIVPLCVQQSHRLLVQLQFSPRQYLRELLHCTNSTWEGYESLRLNGRGENYKLCANPELLTWAPN